MVHDGLQLEINFDPDKNRFRASLDHGEFTVLFECQMPGDDTAPSAAGERLKEFEYAVLGIDDFPAGLALTGRLTAANSLNPAAVAAALSTGNRDRHLIFLSGREATLEQLAETAQLCLANGFANLVAVTGNTYPGETVKENRNRVFSDSVHILELLRPREKQPFFPGGVINPFKYTPETAFPEYFKLIKKFRQGAAFAVAQFGWDMLKLQELRWYLAYRGYHFPTVARLLLLSPELLEKIRRGDLPGVRLSANFQAVLESELKYSRNQFEAAQWRRLELQAAGCRLLGYSGIQIAGLNSPDKIKIAAQRVRAAFGEFIDFRDWAQEYAEYRVKAGMAPYPYQFYLFEDLFSRVHPEPVPVMTAVPPPELSNPEKYSYLFRRFMFPRAHKQMPGTHYFAKKLFASCQECSHCRLPQTFYVCPELCPKGLANGPCGGVNADGSCEHTDLECIYNKMMRLAEWRNQVHRLEEELIPPVERHPR
ncbi:MAG: methylenetetrahydrofolate reductase C-terminal domain-containing protein [Victivallaceae bacterium]|nr:methylenetetrahydrofolate reductase C-terminal domain-containing protein [Victivallaceae bacterium]